MVNTYVGIGSVHLDVNFDGGEGLVDLEGLDHGGPAGQPNLDPGLLVVLLFGWLGDNHGGGGGGRGRGLT